MSLVVEAIYKNGVLAPAQALPLNENERVRLTIETPAPQSQFTYGLIRWTGDPEVVERIALDPEFGVQESP